MPEPSGVFNLFLFQSKLDTVARDQQGIKPLQPALDKIAAVKNAKPTGTVLEESGLVEC